MKSLDVGHSIQLGITVIFTLLLSFVSVCPAQDLKPSEITSSIKKWEAARDVTVPENTKKVVIANVENSAEAIKESDGSISQKQYKKAVSAATFATLDKALQNTKDNRQTGTHSEIQKLDIDSARMALLDTHSAFWDSPSGFGFLTVKSNPVNAEVYVDGDFKGYTATVLGVSVGHHTYEIRGGGTLDCRGDLQILKNRNYQESCPH